MRKLHVVQVTPTMTVAGMEKVIQTICRTIDRDRFAVSVLCLRERAELANEVEAEGTPVVALQDPWVRADHFAFAKVADYLRHVRADVVHSHNTQAFLDGTLGAVLARVPTVVHTDHARAYPDKWRYMTAERVASWYAHAVVGCSADATDNVRKYLKVSPRKLHTIINGIDTRRYRRPADLDATRASLGLPPVGRVIGVIARLQEQKGITYLLQAMPAIAAALSDVTLVIAGQGAFEADLKAEAEATGIGERIRFVGVRHDIPELLQLFDVLVLPSLWEGLPIVILEAMAAGCPIVSTAVGGIPAALGQGDAGVLVPSLDAGALRDGVLRMLTDAGLRRRLTAAAARRVEAEFSAEAMTRHYERLYLRDA